MELFLFIIIILLVLLIIQKKVNNRCFKFDCPPKNYFVPSKNISREVRFVLGLNKNTLFTRSIAGFLRRKSYINQSNTIGLFEWLYISTLTKFFANSFPSKP